MSSLGQLHETSKIRVGQGDDASTTSMLRSFAAAKSLDGRLLCASECAYKIENPYFRGVGFRPGTSVSRITRGSNSCMVGRNVEDGIIVAFRGTMPGAPLDWLQNAATRMKNVPSLPGRIHTGFYGAVMQLYIPLVEAIKDLLQEEPDAKIYFTGHSKGGCMASITAMKMKLDSNHPNVHYIATFGAARVGDEEFRRAYQKEGIRQTSYENHLDMVPFLPPGSNDMLEDMNDKATEEVRDILWEDKNSEKAKSYSSWNYRPVGKRVYIDQNAKLNENITVELDNIRIRAIEKKTILSVNTFRKAHTSICLEEGGGYFAAIAPEICSKCGGGN